LRFCCGVTFITIKNCLNPILVLIEAGQERG
jgi:hypothetical protein